MASTSIYPPIVPSYVPAFPVSFIRPKGSIEPYGVGKCELRFTISSLNTKYIDYIQGIHISVIRQSTGKSVVYKHSDGKLWSPGGAIVIGGGGSGSPKRSLENDTATEVTIKRDKDGGGELKPQPILKTSRYRSSGIIIDNTPLEYLDYDIVNNEKVYKIYLDENDVCTGDNMGWGLGWIYKIQIRFSTVPYDGYTSESAWLVQNASYFSEWSTFCITKAIGRPQWTTPLGYTSTYYSDDYAQIYGDINLESPTLNFVADYANEDIDETLYSYKMTLWEYYEHEIYKKIYNDPEDPESYDWETILSENGVNLLEQTDTIYTNQYYNPNQIQYNFKTKLNNTGSSEKEIEPDTWEYKYIRYYLFIGFDTLNKYNMPLIDYYEYDERSPKKYYYYDIDVFCPEGEQISTHLVTTENIDSVEDSDYRADFNSQTFLAQEEEEGRIGLKLYNVDETPSDKIFIITRADSKDNFQTWTDIKWIVCSGSVINELPMIYDYTIESGVWYKYAIQEYYYYNPYEEEEQELDLEPEPGLEEIEPSPKAKDKVLNEGPGGYWIRSTMNEIPNPIIREFEFSYLVGAGGRQLKLKYNNNMNSYVYNYSESKIDTIGGQYPFITRNGNMKYRTIPVNGLISFNMDEQELFTSDAQLYKYDDVITRYQNRHKDYFDYDYIKERDFREAVLAFLQDGKPKLFKSTTEGNLIIRLMQVAAQPNQSLNRMIFSFTSTAHEIADATMENYLEYGFYSTGEDDVDIPYKDNDDDDNPLVI